jgi:SAM-dependent methyltransferase
MRKSANRGCPICAEPQVDMLHHQRAVVPEGYMLRGAYDVACCMRCGFVYADTADTQEQYDRYYSERSKYADAKTATGGGTSAWDAARLADTARLLSQYLPDQHARIADFGCANGGLLRCLQELGYTQLVGIDPATSCAEYAAQALGVATQVGTLLSAHDADGFDAIVLSHVLEHVRDLQAAVLAIRRMSRPGARVYIEVPDAGRYAAFAVAPFQEFNLEHINHFSAVAIRNLMRGGGFARIAEGDRLIESSPGNPYPVIFSIWRCEEASRPEAQAVERDTMLRDEIVGYVTVSSRLLAEIDAHLRRLHPTHPRIVLWGVGQLALHLLADSALTDFTLTALIDSNPVLHGVRVAGVAVHPPQALRGLADPILVTSLLHQREIARVIRDDMKLDNEIIYLREVS